MSSQSQIPPPAARPPRIDSRLLLQGGKEIVITHGNEEYRLRLTAGGKLILTK
ncbi:MAG TPA: hemin uptake protein HemP [Magnetospirillaceae bacterium]|nr:hemin uptake protein HemP [Magnetospirillaceae bacterium]